jgi:dipeptidyl aminopeptidase/acylaminoacyl peptidase
MWYHQALPGEAQKPSRRITQRRTPVNRHRRQFITLLLIVLPVASLPWTARAEEPLLTVAEKSAYKATSRHADVVDFCQQLAKRSPLIRLGELGTTFEGRKLPLVILADPPVATPEEAAKSNKLVVFAFGNIHAGEVDGKEALMMLARDLAEAPEKPLLKDLILVFAPIFNADGNERMARTNRPGQVGPEEGMGIRTNAQGFDLNRDFIKLESPEDRALARFLTRWNPALTLDLHTTNGSHHRYLITYDGPRNPACDPRLVALARDQLLPDAGRQLEKRSGYHSFTYGNFAWNYTVWEPYPAEPRYSTQYIGLRNRLAVLVESYSYAPYRERIFASRDFTRACLEFMAENRDKVRQVLRAVEDTTVRGSDGPKPDEKIALRHKLAPAPEQVTVLGYEEELKDGRRVATDKSKDYKVQFLDRTEATLSVGRPYAYLFPARFTQAVETMQRHGITVEELREDIVLDVQVYRIDKVARAARTYQKHNAVTVEATPRKDSRRVPAGTVLVRTGQPLGTLAAYILEPQAEDGLCTWNYFDDGLKEGADFVVLRLPAKTPLTAGPVRPLREQSQKEKPLSYEAVYRSRTAPRSFEGSPVGGLIWLDDGEYFLQEKDDHLYQVEARTGRCQPFVDVDRLTKGLASLPALGEATGKSMAEETSFEMNADRTGALFQKGNDFYFARFDGSGAVRLTKTPGRKELVSFSPNGQFIAFVRDGNLFVVDLATQTERALTTDGTELISNGRADWVYFEEIFNRKRRAYWWSPDSAYIAFIRYDDTPVHAFTVLDQIPIQPKVERTPYPKAGAPNPLVKLGIVSAAGGPVHWADLNGTYSETDSLILRAGWTPDSRRVYFYAQNRTQTWLDVCTVPPEGGAPTRLFRETTKAWVDDPGEPTFLKDGSFLLSSERTGWKHLYHFAKDGTLQGTVTSGEWEARTLHRVDEKQGWIYFSGTRDTSLAENLYRVKLDGSGLERLTLEPGDHHVSVSPTFNLFIDSWSDRATPTRVRLSRTDGVPGRMLDTNPVYAREEYRFGPYELVRIESPDGVILEGSLLKPPDFDSSRRYPVWFMTYGGPHAPTIHDSWGGGRVPDQVLAQMGFIVFRCDPRSASGKGACSTWTAYRQLGVPELKDIETAIHWLTSQGYVDPARIGMSGASYGGFMTAYALTHSKLFAAGIATAPVTDWHNYDSIYTERYMSTPQDNPKGYDATSVVKSAAKLDGKLLLVHGLMDDNVHLQNSVQLVHELQRADKDFTIMVYPQARHGVRSDHYRRLTIDFMCRSLGVPPPPGAEETRDGS